MCSKVSFQGPRQKQFGVLGSGEKVYDRPKSHLTGDQNLNNYLHIALEKIVSKGRDFIIETVKFEDEIGQTICVEASSSDEIVYAQRPGRMGLTRFVKNREAVNTSEISMVLKKVPDGWIIITAFFGSKPEKEPWDPLADSKSIKFWETHALVWGSADVVPGTETTNLINKN